MNTTKTLALTSLAIFGSAMATATTWTFDLNPQTGGGPGYGYNAAGGSISGIKSTFNDVSDRLTFEATFGNSERGTLTDGFWLVLNNGKNPKGTSDELALFYFDTGVTNNGQAKLTAYAYNGVNGSNSFVDGSGAAGTQAPDKIASSLKTNGFVNSLGVVNNANGTRTMKFDINAALINNHTPKYGSANNWFGTGFNNKVGLWFHQVDGLDAQYGSDGFLTKFDYAVQGWVDGENLNAVPEPFTMAGVGLVALVARLRKRRA
jgi:hypothetical protein